MSGELKHNKTPIGIDAGATSIKAVQLTHTRKGWRVSAAASIRRATPGAPMDVGEAARLFEALDRQGFDGDRVVLAAPPGALMTEIIALPPQGSGAPLQQIAQVEMGRTHRKEVGTFEMGMWDVPHPARADDGCTVMAAGLSHEDADALLDVFTQAGFEPLAIDVPALALVRAVAPRLDAGQGIAGILDLGADAARLTLTYQGVVIYERTVGEGGFDQLKQQLTERFDLTPDVADYLVEQVGLGASPRHDEQADDDTGGHADPATDEAADETDAGQSAEHGIESAEVRKQLTAYLTAVVKDVRASMEYAQHRYPKADDDGLTLVGGGAMTPGVADYLNRACDRKATLTAPAHLTPCPDTLASTCASAALTLAMGLALPGTNV